MTYNEWIINSICNGQIKCRYNVEKYNVDRLNFPYEKNASNVLHDLQL